MSPSVRGGHDRPLAGCSVVVTREHRGELGLLLDAAGAEVVHLPLIEIADADSRSLERLDAAIAERPDWLIVTSAAGADRVARVASETSVRLGAVGTATAQRLAEIARRPVDLVPEHQLAASLVEAFSRRVSVPQRVVIAQADRAGDVLRLGLENAGHSVDTHTAYRTLIRVPSEQERDRAGGADAVVFASGSAAQGWAEAFGAAATQRLPGIVVAIGPTTAVAAGEMGLKVTHRAAEHSLAGIMKELTAAWRDRSGAEVH